MTKISTIAAFDFDGTATFRDTLLPFLAFARGKPLTALKILQEMPALASYCVGSCSRHHLKEKFISRFFRGMGKQQLQEIGQRFAHEELPKKLRPQAMEQLNWHREQGHRCILVSATLDVYLKPWSQNMGFDDLICTELETDRRGLITGRLIGENCWGPEKARRLEKLLGPRSEYLLYAYGDSRGDHEMLMLADYPFYCSF